MNRVFIVFAALLLLFVLLRIPGVPITYYQDEYKAVAGAEQTLKEAGEIFLHPPLQALLFRLDAVVFGSEFMRLLPLLFGFLSALLLFLIVRRRFDDRTALASVALYSVSFYGIWASLMIDVDGAILPTFFLAALYAYDRFNDGGGRVWLAALSGAVLLGFLTKLSFVLVPIVFLIDFFIQRRSMLTRAYLRTVALFGVGLSALVVLGFSVAILLNPDFQFDKMIEHAQTYIVFGERGWGQTMIQGAKALFYLSPLLVVPLLFLSRREQEQGRPFCIYAIVAFVFYFILFDFSSGALDKYLMVYVVPLAVLSGAIVARVVSFTKKELVFGSVLGVVLSCLLVLVLTLPHSAMPLHPKSEWLASLVRGDFTILMPFMGGSGPAGFYVSLLFIVLAWSVSSILMVLARFARSFRTPAFVALLIVGLTYNAMFVQEFAFGTLYGNVDRALKPAIAFIESDDSIQKVITYNDIGSYELKTMGKHESRFYAVPEYEADHKLRFREGIERGVHFLVVEHPRLYEGFYADFFKTCDTVFATTTGYVPSVVYLCTHMIE